MIRIVFRGELQAGKQREEVAPRLAAALNIPLAQAQALFSGSPVILKRNLPRADFPRYAENLSRLGIVVEMEDEVPASATLPTAPAPAPIKAEPGTPAPIPLPAAESAPADDENLLFPSLFGAAPSSVSNSAPSPTLAPVDTVATAAAPMALVTEVEQINCPKCGTLQPKRTLCRECSVDMPRFAAAQTQISTEPAIISSPNGQPMHASQIAPDIDPADGAEDTPAFRGMSLEGRLCRIRYMAYAVGAMLIAGLVFGLMIPLGLIRNWVGVGFFGLLFLGYLIRLSTLRLHDMDRSGWWQLILIPIVLLQGFGAYKLSTSGSSLLFNLSSLLTMLFTLWLILWPGDRKGNGFGFPNERNTGLGYFGAVLFSLSLISGGIGAKQNRLPGLPNEQQAAQHAMITLYCTSNDEPCVEARDWFSNNPDYVYIDCNIETSPACRSEFDRIGDSVVPLVVVGNQQHNTFDPQWLEKEVVTQTLLGSQATTEE
ncbi:DUF805 domain-containing protein [Chitinibacter sp. GC72]|uniref:DUF805 domain-containing protein n=1 Tax=Chitinibacter sp. GC72 TaxID=1526917 RepID=UPI0012FA0DC6|nr:DUF805 domain-containing protein [Chitinibacter sp. GC72]